MRDIDETISKWAFLVALEKAATAEIKMLRPEVDEHFVGCAERDHGRQYAIVMDGAEVGTFTIKRTEGKPPREWESPEVVDADALRGYHAEEWDAYVDGRMREWADDNIETLALDYLDETGELPDGVAIVTRMDVGTAPGINGTMARVDPMKVSRALAEHGLPVSLRGLLEGGE